MKINIGQSFKVQSMYRAKASLCNQLTNINSRLPFKRLRL